MIILLIIFIGCIHATDVILIDTAIPEHGMEQSIKNALKHAFDRYMNDQDKISAIVFDGKKAKYLFQNVRCIERDRIFLAIDSIQFTVGCADWALGLDMVDLSANNVYLITDENPCGKDPTERATLLKKHGMHIHTIGIGPKIDPKWLKIVGNSHYISSRYTFKNNAKRNIVSKHDLPTESLTGGEIAAVVIISILLVALIVFSCWYACRMKPEQKIQARVIRRKINQRV